MKIKSVIIWPRGRKTVRYVDFSNAAERHQFARFAQSALERGATVTTRAVAVDPQSLNNQE